MEHDVFQYYRKMRKEGPVHFNHNTGSWDVFDYKSVYFVLMNPDIYSSDPSYAGNIPENRQGPGASFITMDNPDHKELRNVTVPYFLTSKINEYRNMIESTSKRLMAGINKNSDFIRDYAVMLPVTVISELLGVPENERSKFKEWSDYIIGNRSDAGFQELNNYMYSTMAEIFKTNTEDNIISTINKGLFHSEPLSINQKIGYVMLLVIGGNETTTNLIGNMVKVLSEHPEIADKLRQEPELKKGFIEETLRYYSPIQFLPHRFAARDSVLNGQEIKKGQRLSIWLGSANRDGTKFEDPDTFNMERQKNDHLAFGMGIHMCLGSPLARLEAEIALNDILNKFKHVKINAEKTAMLKNPMVYGFSTMQLDD